MPAKLVRSISPAQAKLAARIAAAERELVALKKAAESAKADFKSARRRHKAAKKSARAAKKALKGLREKFAALSRSTKLAARPAGKARTQRKRVVAAPSPIAPPPRDEAALETVVAPPAVPSN